VILCFRTAKHQLPPGAIKYILSYLLDPNHPLNHDSFPNVMWFRLLEKDHIWSI